jgi:hypothetical protein
MSTRVNFLITYYIRTAAKATYFDDLIVRQLQAVPMRRKNISLTSGNGPVAPTYRQFSVNWDVSVDIEGEGEVTRAWSCGSSSSWTQARRTAALGSTHSLTLKVKSELLVK